MKRLFFETIESKKDRLPGGWIIEKNSDLSIPSLEYTQDSIRLLSAGNKYIPVIPDISSGRIRFTAGINFTVAGHFAILVSFRYDLKTRRGEAVRILRKKGEKETVVEYGGMKANRFTPEQSRKIRVPDSVLEQPFKIEMDFHEEKLRVKLADAATSFRIQPSGSGKIALSREHFFDILKITSFEIETEEESVCKGEKKFRIPLPDEPTLYPIFCDVVLRDFGNCMDAELTFSGGVPETPIGEGNYHVMRADLLTNPFLKVLTARSMEKYIVYEGQIVLVVEKLAPAFFYQVLHKKVDWPFKRSVRFLKPEEPFNLAVGFDEYCHTTLKNLAQSPSETIFDPKGKILYSGLGVTEETRKLEFLSQPDKRILSLLPKNDPRYKKAVEFAKNNHYFIEGEPPRFTLRLTGGKELPADFEVELEDAYLQPVRKLKFKRTSGILAIGVRTFTTETLEVEPLPKLAPGVYHLRCRSFDPSVPGLDDYRAFEVMSRKKNSAPPPVLSGLPWLYDSRTETRGLDTDAFDPWTGKSVDSGHYMACANFLPAAARRNHIAPTVHAYQREWFLWLGSRCADQWSMKDNRDLLKEADYANVEDELERACSLWRGIYKGFILEKFIECARKTGDPGFDFDKLEEQLRKGECVDAADFVLMAGKYWEEWLDLLNAEFVKKSAELLKKLRKDNPKLKFASYGPAPIYAAHLKGPEFTRLNLKEKEIPDSIGFWQYEDYPFACRYGLERGTYFLTSSLMVFPEMRIYPEIYTGGIQGCPDGAVFYAHPPFGRRTKAVPIRMTRRVYDYACASAHFTGHGFRYWDRCGFQACGFTRPWFEALLKGWRIVNEYPPERPLKSSGFVSSEESRRAHKNAIVRSGHGPNEPIEKAGIIDVRKTATEDVPFAYEAARKHGLCAGFQLWMEDLPRLNAEQVDLLVLPPLEGVSRKYLDAIRKLHAKGVHLLAFEDVPGLEDLFGVADTGKYRSVTQLSAQKDFLGGMTEFCEEPLCRGKYKVKDAEVLIDAEIPVLTLKRNERAMAAFFNVPPMLVREDQLHERLGYGKDGISELIELATAEVMKKMSDAEAASTEGRLIAYHSGKGADVVIVTNPEEEAVLTPEITILKHKGRQKIVFADIPCIVLEDTPKTLRIRTRLEPEETAVFILG